MVLPSLILAFAAASTQWLFAAATQDIIVPFDQLAYTAGNWSRFSDLSPINCTGGASISFGVSGATASYTFRGVAVVLNVITATDGSTAEILLDGESTTVGTLSSAIRCSVEIFNRTGLDWNTQHVLSIRSTQANSLGIRGLTYTTLTQSEQISLSSAASSTRPPTSASTGAPKPSTTQSSSDGGSNTGAIVGGVVGGIAGLAIIIALIWFALRRGNKKKQDTTDVRGDHALQYGQPYIEPQHTQPPPMMQQQQQQPYLGPQFPSNPNPYPVSMSPGPTSDWSHQAPVAQQQPYPQQPYPQQPYPQQQYPQQQFAQQQSFPQQGYPQGPINYQPMSPPPPGAIEPLAMGHAYPLPSTSPTPSAGASTSVPSSAPPPSDVKSAHGPPSVPVRYPSPAPAYDAGPGH